VALVTAAVAAAEASEEAEAAATEEADLIKATLETEMAAITKNANSNIFNHHKPFF
jgi:hypothetical protein